MVFSLSPPVLHRRTTAEEVRKARRAGRAPERVNPSHPLTMKKLTDEQYKSLQDYASQYRMSLHGYQTTGGGILLNNSKTTGVFGRNMSELRKAIQNS